MVLNCSRSSDATCKGNYRTTSVNSAVKSTLTRIGAPITRAMNMGPSARSAKLATVVTNSRHLAGSYVAHTWG